MKIKVLDLSEWKEFARSKKNISIFVISFLSTTIMLHFTANFICNIESRPGFGFDDPILSRFEPINLTWLIFITLYSSIFATFFYLLQFPRQLSLAFFAYALLLVFRISAMYLLPLEPPEKIILLKDPIIENFGTEVTLTKDLFFSGHTSLMFLLFLLVNNRALKILLLLGTIIVGGGILLQHVHYTIDVFIAIFAAYSAYGIVNFILTKSKFLTKNVSG
ncbi:MAG: sphingomyelin synthase family protein [Ignavibacteria bacterium]|nr:sphingomyelin synthase family protein [Ignavibacteria bacterium]